jgi:superfamily II DNA or RNA helicase/SOS-response transcriptional repressor LexA
MKNPRKKSAGDRSAEGFRTTDAMRGTSAIGGERLHCLKLKLLEEVHQLFLSTDRGGFLSEAAGVVEILHAMAAEHGIEWDEIEQARANGCGGCAADVFLHAVYGESAPHDQEPATPHLLINGQSPSLLEVLRRELHGSRTCQVATAFCTRAMLNVLLRPFEDFLARGGELSLLTSVMNNFNNPDDLLHLRHQLPACRLRIYYPGEGDGPDRFAAVPSPFHLKCFLFEKHDGRNALIVGSSNLTAGGLGRNEEWNLYSNSEVNLPFRLDDDRSIFETARQQFRRYWETDSVELSEDFLEVYRARWQRARLVADKLRERLPTSPPPPPRPRPAQVEALEALGVRRRLGIRRCAVIAATGLGKTHLAAFDFRQSAARNVLFIAHRETILREAREVFRNVLGDPDFGVVLSRTASAEERRAACRGRASAFAMIQTLSRRNFLKQFDPRQFDYVVVDEFHHSEAATYRAVLDHFEPRFLLGLTATPERMDGRDVLRLCDYNVAYEARLFDAIDQGWLVPFQYFALHDESDYSALRWTGMGYDEEELERHLSTDTRADLIVNNLRRFLPATGKIKALAFCANRGHARYMTRQFIRRGFKAECLLGDSSEAARAAAIERLQDEDDPLQVICSVDIFGEGVDVPAVSHVLLLRPTLSFTVFLQQLGRGLRPAAGKDFLVALDFVGNSRNSYIVPLILRGCTSLEDFRGKAGGAEPRLPSSCTVDVDTQVQRIWDEEIKRTLAPRNRHQLLQQTYRQMRDDLGRVPTLLDFFANPDACDPQAFVKHYGNWLRTKEEAGDLTDYERQLLGTPGEAFLQHVEKELNSVRSYKMVVLLVLLEGDRAATEWQVDWIARAFRQHYLDNLEQLADCSPLAGAADPQAVPLGKIASLLKSMPLKYLSNTDSDYFTFDPAAGTFALKAEVHAYWRDPQFRELLRERVLYSLIRYFHAKGIDLTSYAFDLDRPAPAEDDTPTAAPAVPTTSLPFFPTLHIAAGCFREATGKPNADTIEVPDPRERFRPDRHFVVQVEGDSMDGGRTPIHDGDYIVLERLDASRAGSLTAERAMAVEYREESGDTAYALKQIRKDERGAYWLHSWNREYADIRVNPEAMFPFARLVEVLPGVL